MKHKIISRALLEEIAAGKYAAVKRLPSESQLVQRFGVSRPTVARALRDLEEAGVIERRVGSGTYLKRGKGGLGSVEGVTLLGMIVPDFGRIEIFEVICGELASLSRTHNVQLLWGQQRMAEEGHCSVEEMLGLCNDLIAQGCAGVFFAPVEYTENSEQINEAVVDTLRGAGVPVVLIDRDYRNFPMRSEYDLVSVDHFHGGYLLAEHLIKRGSRRLAFVTKPRSASAVAFRVAGAMSAMVGQGVSIPENFVREGDPTDLKFVKTLKSSGPLDAVICTNDHTAAQLLQSLNKLGVNVPRDLKVVGFDDVRYATLLSVPLTTIHQPCRDIAVAAFKAMQERMADPTMTGRSIRLTPQLIVRESCGAYLQ